MADQVHHAGLGFVLAEMEPGVGDWALAGHGIMLRTQADICAELAAGWLEQVLPDWSSGPAPIYALLPSARRLATKSRVFLDAMAERLAAL